MWYIISVGFDRGLRMGGLCKHKTTGKRGIVLGIRKKGATSVKVQWEVDGDVSDVLISLLEHIEPTPFCVNKLNGTQFLQFQFCLWYPHSTLQSNGYLASYKPWT